MKFIPRVYLPVALAIGTIHECDKNVSHYLTTVLRLKSQNPIILFNGLGGEYLCEITLSDPKKTRVHINSFDPVSRESPLDLQLGHGLARGDKMDLIIQKATELGVKRITPLITHHSLVKLDDARAEKRHQHWQKIMISACEQSGRTSLPLIDPPLLLSQWTEQKFEGLSVFFDPKAQNNLHNIQANKAIRIAIGPESGWNEHEIDLMQKQAFLSATLGPRILRTETAGITCLSLIQALFGDLM